MILARHITDKRRRAHTQHLHPLRRAEPAWRGQDGRGWARGGCPQGTRCHSSVSCRATRCGRCGGMCWRRSASRRPWCRRGWLMARSPGWRRRPGSTPCWRRRCLRRPAGGDLRPAEDPRGHPRRRRTLIYYILGDNGASAEGTLNGLQRTPVPQRRRSSGDHRIHAGAHRRVRQPFGVQPLRGELPALDDGT